MNNMNELARRITNRIKLDQFYKRNAVVTFGKKTVFIPRGGRGSNKTPVW